jgi:NhaA family Na+:H+ antiporter
MRKSPIDKVIEPLSRFISQEFMGGVILFISVVFAILWVNSSAEESYRHLWELTFSIGFNGQILDYPLHAWINDGLMAIFFFVIGLELKREFIAGELSTIKKASLPMVAAIGGMIVPAGIYLIINHGLVSQKGWGVPMATDIAFALALLSLAGKHIPSSVKVFLSALAVADDLGAILVIAFFYSTGIEAFPLLIAAVFLLLLALGNWLGIRSVAFYIIFGFVVWVGFLLSGVHATIAGVFVAFTIPARAKIDENQYSSVLRKLINDFNAEIPNNSTLTTPEQHYTIQKVKKISADSETPLQKIEYALHPWVAFGIIPVFALANAGMAIRSDFFSSVLNPVSMGVSLGLVAGKFIGVFSFSWLFVRFSSAQLPHLATWKHLAGVALLAGVGFTMSLFITGLAFSSPETIDQSKYGILLASVVSGLLGLWVLRKR